MSSENLLFHKVDSFSVQEHQRTLMQRAIAGIEENRLLNSNADDLAVYFAEQYSVNVPILDEEGMHVDQCEVQIDVSQHHDRYISDRSRAFYVTGTRITVWVPFEGDEAMFYVRPNTFNYNPPRATIANQSVIFNYEGTNLGTEQVKQEIERWLSSVKDYLAWQQDTFKGFNNTLLREAQKSIENRREKLLADQNLVSGLGIPLRRRANELRTYTAPEVKRKVAPKLPTATTGQYKPEPVLEMAEYEHILSVVQSMVKVMERSPSAFCSLDEEAIRTHFLVQLNGHYEGQATGETFNYSGKTDILIRSGDRNVFIAECKVWAGPAKLTEAIEQLLGYLSWRDSKAALFIFNRNKDFSRVLDAIPKTAQAHPNFRKDLGSQGNTDFRYVFRHSDDNAKDLTMTILAFDIPRVE